MIIKYCNILIVRALAIILVDMCEAISTSTGQPEFGSLVILCSTKVDIRSSITRELILHWRIIETHYFTIMSLNTLDLFIGGIERRCGVLLQIMNSNIACPVTAGQVLTIWRYFNASQLLQFSLLLSGNRGILLGRSIFI